MRRACGPETARNFDSLLRASVDFAMTHPFASAEFVLSHAEETDPHVVRQHIELYVNQYTRALDLRAVDALLAFGVEQGLFPQTDTPLMAYA